MATERIRVFNGATELTLKSGILTKSDDQIIDQVRMESVYDSSLSTGTLLSFKKSDGSTTIFTGTISKSQRPNINKLTVLSYGSELNRLMIETNYVGKSPEYIVQDIIDNYTTNLTYASTTTSGVTIDYIAQDYAITILTEMMELLDWSIRIDESNNVYFEPKGHTDNGVVLTNGSNCNVVDYIEDKDGLFNIAKVRGGFESYITEETITGTGTEFTLSYKPNANVKAVVSGSEVSADDYTVDAPNKKIKFDSSKTDPTFTYSYDKPIIVLASNDDSINTYGMEITKTFEAPFLNNVADVKAYAQSLVDLYGLPMVSAIVDKQGFDFDIVVGENVTLIDPIRNIDRKLTITKLVYDFLQGKTTIYLGSREYTIVDYFRSVKERIRKLERRFSSSDKTILSKTTSNNLDIELTTSQVFEYASPRNSFYLDHPTLSYPRTGYNDEPDCSGNGNYGTWSSANNGGIIDDADSVTGSWVAVDSSDSVSLNTDEYIEGSGSINLIKNSSLATFEATLSFSSIDMSGSDMYVRLWLYIKDSTTYGKFSPAPPVFNIIDGSGNYDYYLMQPLSIGWNRFDFLLGSADGNSGTALDPTDVQQVKIHLGFNSTSNMLAAGEVMVDILTYGNIDGSQFNHNYGYYESSSTSNQYPRLCNAFFHNNAYLTVPDDSSLDGFSNFIIYGRVKFDDISGTKPIIQKWTGTASSSSYKLYSYNNRIYLEVSDGTNTSSFDPGTMSLTTGTWYNIAVVFVAGVVTMYIDGTAYSTTKTGTVTSINTSTGTDVKVGTDGTNYFKGEMDEIIIEEKVGTAQDISNYNLKIFDTTNYKLWLSFDNALLGNYISPRMEVT